LYVPTHLTLFRKQGSERLELAEGSSTLRHEINAVLQQDDFKGDGEAKAGSQWPTEGV